MRKIFQRLAAAVLLATSVQASAGVLPVIEVNNPVSWPGAGAALTRDHYQQSFSVSQKGLLSGFGIFGGSDTNLSATVSIKVGTADGWQTGGWTAVIFPRLDGSLVDLTSFNLQVNAGDSVIFDVGQSTASVWMTRVGLGTLYSKNNNSDFPFHHVDRSLAFTTWMVPDIVTPIDPAPPAKVPAPGAGILTLLGLAMLAVARRFRASPVR